MIADAKAKSGPANAISLWADGRSIGASVIWLSQTDAELLVEQGVSLGEGQKLLLVIADFVTLPLRVRCTCRQHVSVQFDNMIHRSVLQMIMRQMPGAGIMGIIEHLEERAMPGNRFAEMEAWLREDSEDDVDLGMSGEIDCCGGLNCDCVLEAA